MTERLGIFGGTFDPIHVGHIVAATTVRHAFELDRLLLVVAGDQWQKRGKIVADSADRLAMVRAAVAGIDGIEASSIEIDRGRPSYTDETLEALSAPGRELFLVLGADAARNTGTWVAVERCQAMATLVVVSRAGDPGQPADPAAWRWSNVEIPWLDISSSDLRQRLADGRPVDGLVPPAALALIRERGLYGVTAAG
ncbi:MAG: nicotinate-nucleotide adenylyltransferase [Acidimicrobiia bacterium]